MRLFALCAHWLGQRYLAENLSIGLIVKAGNYFYFRLYRRLRNRNTPVTKPNDQQKRIVEADRRSK